MSKSILVLDDSEGTLAELADKLSSQGYGTLACGDIAGMVAAFGKNAPELVIASLEGHAPESVCEAIRSDPNGAIIPIVLIGHKHLTIRSVADALAAGADYFFERPLKLDKVVAKIQTYIGAGDSTKKTKPAVQAVPPSAIPTLGNPTALGGLLPPPPSFEWQKSVAAPNLAGPSEALLAMINAQEASTKAPDNSQTARAAEEALLQERQTREAQERAHQEARERLAQEERMRAEAMAKAQLEAEERARRELEEKVRKDAEEAARREHEIRLQQEAAEKARLEAEERARRELENEMRLAAEEAAKREQIERMRAEAEERVRRELADKMRVEAEEKARREELEKQGTQERMRLEVERRLLEEQRKALEEKVRAELLAREQLEKEFAVREQQIREQMTRELAQKEAQAKAAAEAEAAQRAREAEAQAKLQAEQKAKEEADAEMRRQVEAEVRKRMGAITPIVVQPTPAREEAIPDNFFTPMTPPEGLFGEGQDVGDILAKALEQKVTGRLDFVADNRQKSLFLENGLPVDAYSGQVFDRMEEYLLREGKITRQQYQEVRVKGLKGPRRVGSYLVSAGFLKPHELFEAVRGHLVDVLYGLFDWEKGSYRYLREKTLEDDRVLLDSDPKLLILEGIRRKYLMPRLIRRVGGPGTLVTLKAPNAGDILHLPNDEQHLVKLIDGTRNVEDLVFSSGIDSLRVYHVVCTLVTLGYAEVVVRGVEVVREDGVLSADTIDRDRIRDKVEQVRQLDYFQILGVARNATPYEIEKAYERTLHEFEASRFSIHVQHEMHSDLQEITQVVADAREVLQNEHLRNSYARHLPA